MTYLVDDPPEASLVAGGASRYLIQANHFLGSFLLFSPCFILITGTSQSVTVTLISWISSIGPKKYLKNINFRYLYPVEVRNYGIYVWNRFHFERVEKVLSC
uniref:Uncharacterized protein n=1 Tax=Manihot esculenta TaxID=3983 RepID=A0A2C9VMI6_MANES